MHTIEDLRNVEKEIAELSEVRKKIMSEIAVSGGNVFAEDAEKLPWRADFKGVDSLDINEDTVVAYQGVPGAYSHQAMFKFFGDDIKNINVEAFEDVIDVINSGKADYGVLPIENSSAGFVNGIYDMVGKSNLTVVGEDRVHVAHALLGVPGAEISDIKQVYSHPQGLMQCKDFLDTTDWERINVANTAVAAQKVINEQDRTHAAIASELAGRIYGLDILKKGIVNNNNNTTRFIILARGKMYVKSGKNVIISFSLPHESGTLYNILSNINLNGINLTNIESRPLKGKTWEYKFFVTMEGNMDDPRTISALSGIYRDSLDFRLIGTY